MNRYDLGQPHCFRQMQKPHGTPGRLVRQADLAYFSLFNQFREGGQAFLDGGLVSVLVNVTQFAEIIGIAIRPMQLIQIDIISLKASKTVADRLMDMCPSMTWTAPQMLHGVAWPGRFGRDHPVLAPAGFGKPITDVLLRQTLSLRFGGDGIHFGTVHKIDAAL